VIQKYNNVGRNDLCPCGSGVKYKKCHCAINDSETELQPNTWIPSAAAVTFDHTKRPEIERTFIAVSDDLKKYPNPGACHLISSVMMVLFSEQNIDAKLMVGVVRRADGRRFDHSWIEISEKVFDVAIELTYDEQKNPPVFASIDLGNGNQTSYSYGVGHSLDLIGKTILKTPFSKYMDKFPAYKNGGWDVVQRIAKNIDLIFDINTLRTKYSNLQRTEAV
jgi:hypothetical protein